VSNRARQQVESNAIQRGEPRYRAERDRPAARGAGGGGSRDPAIDRWSLPGGAGREGCRPGHRERIGSRIGAAARNFSPRQIRCYEAPPASYQSFRMYPRARARGEKRGRLHAKLVSALSRDRPPLQATRIPMHPGPAAYWALVITRLGPRPPCPPWPARCTPVLRLGPVRTCHAATCARRGPNGGLTWRGPL